MATTSKHKPSAAVTELINHFKGTSAAPSAPDESHAQPDAQTQGASPLDDNRDDPMSAKVTLREANVRFGRIHGILVYWKSGLISTEKAALMLNSTEAGMEAQFDFIRDLADTSVQAFAEAFPDFQEKPTETPRVVVPDAKPDAAGRIIITGPGGRGSA